MDERSAIQRRLLAGSFGPERLPVRPNGAEPRWFETLHVREPRSARERLAAQVAAGADVVVAPTWQTHRRALLAVGETRQARAWTAAAIRIGREAIEIGLERRGDDAADAGADHPGDDPDGGDAHADDAPGAPAAPLTPASLRPVPLLAASLPALDEIPEPGMGRLLPRQAATERDYRDQAGLLADAEPDLLLVEGQSTVAEARLAVAAALDTGLPVWVASRGLADDVDASARLIDALGGLSVDCLLLAGLPQAQPPPRAAWGACLDASANGATADRWLDAGARVLAVLDGATPARLGPIRAAIDRTEEGVHQERRAANERWWAHVRRAAGMAEGGAAVWLVATAGDVPLAERLPGGFDWLVVPRDEIRLLPERRFRLVVDASGDPEPASTSYGRWLLSGGVLASRGVPPLADAARLRMLVIDETQEPPLVIARREG